MGKLKTLKTNIASPGQPMTFEEMEQSIREAENGKFLSIAELGRKVEEWKKKFAK